MEAVWRQGLRWYERAGERHGRTHKVLLKEWWVGLHSAERESDFTAASRRAGLPDELYPKSELAEPIVVPISAQIHPKFELASQSVVITLNRPIQNLTPEHLKRILEYLKPFQWEGVLSSQLAAQQITNWRSGALLPPPSSAHREQVLAQRLELVAERAGRLGRLRHRHARLLQHLPAGYGVLELVLIWS
jgi:hypothetical protein